MPVFYECQRCAACCRWPGQVRLTQPEINSISDALDVTVADFVDQYTRLRPDRKGLALNEKPNGECVFLESGRCSIQAVKPQQCRDFPNLWRNPGQNLQCQAIPIELEEKEYRLRVSKATGRSVETLKKRT